MDTVLQLVGILAAFLMVGGTASLILIEVTRKK